jgi:hypothetical protein
MDKRTLGFEKTNKELVTNRGKGTNGYKRKEYHFFDGDK